MDNNCCIDYFKDKKYLGDYYPFKQYLEKCQLIVNDPVSNVEFYKLFINIKNKMISSHNYHYKQ